jgi:hypothetical protein
MKALNNKMLWSKAGFVTFNSRQKAVDFWKACGSQDLAVQGGRVIADDFHFYYVAKVGEVATKRVQDYVRFADVHGLGMHTYIAPNA